MMVSSQFSEIAAEAIVRVGSVADVDIIAGAVVSQAMVTEVAVAAAHEAAAEADSTATLTRDRHRRQRGLIAEAVRAILEDVSARTRIFMVTATIVPTWSSKAKSQYLGMPSIHFLTPISHKSSLSVLYR